MVEQGITVRQWDRHSSPHTPPQLFPAHRSQNVGAASQGGRRPRRAHQQQRVLGHQPCRMAACRLHLLPQLRLLFCAQAGAVGQQELLPAAQRAPPLISCVVVQRLVCRQQPPLLPRPAARGSVAGCSRLLHAPAQEQVQPTGSSGGGGGDVPLQSLCPDVTAAHLSTCTCSVRVRKRTEGSAEALPSATAAPSSASANSALLCSDHRMFKPLASRASRTPALRVPGSARAVPPARSGGL